MTQSDRNFALSLLPVSSREDVGALLAKGVDYYTAVAQVFDVPRSFAKMCLYMHFYGNEFILGEDDQR